MEDIKLGKYCDHRIIDEPLIINGISPNYFATLEYPANQNLSQIKVRIYNDTEDITEYNYLTDGFTNWSLNVDGTKINFNTQGFMTGAASFLDGGTLIYPSPLALVTYLTLKEACPKCQGTGVVNDYVLKGTGDFNIVQGKEKVRQILYKALLTSLGSNQYHPEFGSDISSSIGTKYTFFRQVQLQKSIQDSIQAVIEEQTTDPNLSLDETIIRIDTIDVNIDPKDPRGYDIVVAVTTGEYEAVKAGLKIRVE